MDGTPRRRAAARSRARAAVAALACIASLAAGCGAPEIDTPNLLLVTVDSLRADALACYGGEPEVGTRMCALADRGARYAWAFSPSPSSAPAIASIMTSQYPSSHRVDESAASFLHDGVTTLAEELRRAGYATAAFVGSAELNRSRNLQQGFDLYDDRMSRSETGGLPWRSAADSTELALGWIEGAPSPWFVWIHYQEPHGPYRSALDVLDETPSGPGERLPVLPTPQGRGGIPSYQAIPGLFTREAYEARYRREIRAVDSQLARLLIEIDEEGNPIGVLLTADHGEAMGEDRYYFSHGHSVGLDQIRVPLLWRAPRGAAEQIRVAVSTLDVMPTLLRAAGLATPDSADGRPLPGGADPPGAPEQARAVFAEHPQEVAVVSGSNYYARLRVPAAAVQPGLTAPYLRAVAARTAQLGNAGDALPPYEPARPSGITPLLEPRVAEFLERETATAGSGTAPPAPPAPPAPAVPAEPTPDEPTPDEPPAQPTPGPPSP